jgi:hypothetical protein
MVSPECITRLTKRKVLGVLKRGKVQTQKSFPKFQSNCRTTSNKKLQHKYIKIAQKKYFIEQLPSSFSINSIQFNDPEHP